MLYTYHQNEDSHFENQRLQMFKKADEHFPIFTSLERASLECPMQL